MSIKRILGVVLFGQLAFLSPAMAQVDVMKPPVLGFCDPLLSEPVNIEIGDDDNEEVEQVVRRFDLETVEVLVSEAEVMDALYEEKWDLATGTPIERNELCNKEPSYVVHWTEVIETDAQGEPFIQAKGLFSFHRDNSFTYIYADRPYRGTWDFSAGEMQLSADWLRDGDPLIAPVERVVTPVQIFDAEGALDGEYNEVVYRVGMFRNLRIATTAKGQIRKCSC